MRTLYDADHEAFRESFASFVAKEVSPHYLEWEEAGIAPREMYASAGQYGFVGMAIPEQYGGGGTDDFRFNAILSEEFNAAGIGGAGLGLTLHNDICTPYFIEYCTDGAGRTMDARHRVRRPDHRRRHDRARHWLRPRQHRHHRDP